MHGPTLCVGPCTRNSSALGGGGRLPGDLIDHVLVGERGDVAQVTVLGDVLEQPAHDLAAARLGQAVGEATLVGAGEFADLVGNAGSDLSNRCQASGMRGYLACPQVFCKRSKHVS